MKAEVEGFEFIKKFCHKCFLKIMKLYIACHILAQIPFLGGI